MVRVNPRNKYRTGITYRELLAWANDAMRTCMGENHYGPIRDFCEKKGISFQAIHDEFAAGDGNLCACVLVRKLVVWSDSDLDQVVPMLDGAR